MRRRFTCANGCFELLILHLELGKCSPLTEPITDKKAGNLNSIARLETDRLQLRAIYPADANDLYDIYSDPRVAEFYDFDPIQTIEQADELIRRFTRWFQADQAVRWGMFAKADQRMIGTCCFDAFQVNYHSVNLGYNLRSDHWGQGFVSEACSAIIDYAFNYGLASPVNRIQAITDPANVRSSQVLERLGFQLEGVMRQYGFWKGAYHDMKLFSRLKSDQV